MEFTDDEVQIDKEPSDLDRLVLDVVSALESVGVEYAVVSGYVVVLFGRARATEDVDVITERFDAATADALADRLADGGFWGPAMPLDSMFETLADDLPVRIAEEGHRVPNVELKFASDDYDRRSLQETVTVRFGDETLHVGGLELQIAYKLHMDTPHDFEDALYLYDVTEPTLNTEKLEASSTTWTSPRPMTDSEMPDPLEEKHARNRERRLKQIKAWAEYVRTHPDDDWGPQVNRLVNSQLESARHHEDERTDLPRRDE